MTEKFAKPSTNRDGEAIRKVIVFTAFADTAKYLWNHLAKPLHESTDAHAALIVGSGSNQTTLGRPDFEHILNNFSPRAKGRDRQPELPQDQEIDLLIATDCISEGQNLQDCDLLINFDIHWNPVRIFQRFGRIDRIGSRNERVSLVNFWPTKDLDAYLNVKYRVEARMALVDLTAFGEDNLLDNQQFEDLIETELHYRNKQLKPLQNESLDLEDLDEEVISLADFSLTDFRLDLLRFLEANREALESSPLGLYAVVKPDPRIPAIRPGILFCFRQRGDKQTTEVNPLAPHYLLYVLDDGNVRLGFAQPKQSLEVFRALATGRESADAKLHDLFDARTGNGDISREAQVFYDRHFSADDPAPVVLRLGLTTPPSYDFPNRRFTQPIIELGIQIGGRTIAKPQTFLNEAKLTQLALSVRFAASLVNLHESDVKLLVLDDLLVSLDMSNRMRVVEILLSETFADYQKIILTHDRGFFHELRRVIADQHGDWCFRSLTGNAKDGIAERQEKNALQKAADYLNGYALDEAALQLRKAVEETAKRYRRVAMGESVPPGEFHSLSEDLRAARNHLSQQIPLDLCKRVVKGMRREHRDKLVSSNDDDLDADSSLDAAARGKIKAQRRHLRQFLSQVDWRHLETMEVLDAVLRMKDRVLNPAAHWGEAPLYDAEVRKALRLVARLEKCLKS